MFNPQSSAWALWGHGNTGDRIDMVCAEGVVATYGYVDSAEPVVRITAPETDDAYELVSISQGGKELARHPIISRALTRLQP